MILSIGSCVESEAGTIMSDCFFERDRAALKRATRTSFCRACDVKNLFFFKGGTVVKFSRVKEAMDNEFFKVL
jgi:hypothetical protein